jgi:hypothetical protein
MAKKEQPMNSNTNLNIVNVNIPERKRSYAKKAKKPNWLLRALVVTAIGTVVSIVLTWVQRSTAANGKPAYIQSAPTADSK